MTVVAKRKPSSKTDQCLVVGEDGVRCDREERTRGLCDSHYSIARLLVNNEDTGVSWAKLEAQGKAKPLAIKRGATQFFMNGKKV